jgi:rhodanese-related sulfurtransferase
VAPHPFVKKIFGPNGWVPALLPPAPAARVTAVTVDELLAQARAILPHRPSPAEALRAQADGAVLVDIRGDYQRRDGLIPGALVVPRNSLEWRCDPASEWRHPAFTRHDLRLILVCHEGYQSSLAAATLQQLGLVYATDLDGGFTAWTAAGLPVLPGQDTPSTAIYSLIPIASTGRVRSAWRVGTDRATRASSAEAPRIAANQPAGT